MSILGVGAGAVGGTGFYPETIDQSLRFEDGDSPYLDRTPSSASNRDTFTVSFWIKRANLGSIQILWQQGGSNNNSTQMQFYSDDTLRYQHTDSGSATDQLITNAKFRDTTNWYHILLSVDTTQATDTNRVKLYVNGTEQTYSTANYPAQNVDTDVNSTGKMRISGQVSGTLYPIDGYYAEFNLIDGTALDPTSFGESKNGTWIPKSLSSLTYGTNGFRLTFADSSSLGDDTSGNGNDFTSSGLASTDVATDSPTNNFATLTVLNSNTNATLSEGGLRALMGGSGNYDQVRSDFGLSSGKWYWEVYVEDRGYIPAIGVSAGYRGPNSDPEHWVTLGFGAWHATYNSSVPKYNVNQNSGGGTNWGVTMPATNDIVMIALDVDNNKIWWGRNGTWYNSSGTANPATGTDARVTLTSDQTWHPMLTLDTGASSLGANNAKMRMNFGADSTFAGLVSSANDYSNYANASDENNVGSFFYAPPSGYLACCSSSLEDTTLSPNKAEQATDYMDTAIWSGDSSSSRNIDLYDFQPDWIWIKNRTNANIHIVNDSSRGVSTALDKALVTNNTDPEGLGVNHTSSTVYGGVSAFRSNGFTLTEGSTDARYVNHSSYTYVGWAWKAGGTAPTKTYKVVVVSDSGNKYRFRNSADSATFAQSAVALDLQEGGTYVFDWSDSSAQGHPFRFSTTSDGTHGGGSEYTTGVVKDDSAYTTTITVASSAPQLYYYCSIHSGMGGSVSTNSTFGSTNFDGSILSVAQASTESGFGISLYTGNSTAGATVGHELGSVPNMMLVKCRSNSSSSDHWYVYHSGIASNAQNYETYFNLNLGVYQNANLPWNNTAPTSTVFSLGSLADVNETSETYIAYLFSEREGFSKFGSYTGTTQGTYVFLGFRPSWILFKRTDSADNWTIFDVVRDTFNPLDSYIYADNFNTEATFSSAKVDALSNGFKWRGTVNFGNANGGTYIYMAFAQQPAKFANAR